MVTQLTSEECGILALAVAGITTMSKMGMIRKPWCTATEQELLDLVGKLEQIQKEVVVGEME